jgi:16S rRNA A1518/A1519 N6-dimethyltransferase RsmA/KsgA/DIM1 with predicted DNA glycosylase/AP lyase activity
MKRLSRTANVLVVIDICVKIISLCLKYSIAVKNAKKRFQKKINDMKNVLDEVKRLLNERKKTLFSTIHKFSNSLKKCFAQLQELNTQLKFEKTRKIMNSVAVELFERIFGIFMMLGNL